jgi:hypothetical protein
MIFLKREKTMVAVSWFEIYCLGIRFGCIIIFIHFALVHSFVILALMRKRER